MKDSVDSKGISILENEHLKIWFSILVKEFKNTQELDKINIFTYYNNLTICYPITEYIFKTLLEEEDEIFNPKDKYGTIKIFCKNNSLKVIYDSFFKMNDLKHMNANFSSPEDLENLNLNILKSTHEILCKFESRKFSAQRLNSTDISFILLKQVLKSTQVAIQAIDMMPDNILKSTQVAIQAIDMMPDNILKSTQVAIQAIDMMPDNILKSTQVAIQAIDKIPDNILKSTQVAIQAIDKLEVNRTKDKLEDNKWNY